MQSIVEQTWRNIVTAYVTGHACLVIDARPTDNHQLSGAAVARRPRRLRRRSSVGTCRGPARAPNRDVEGGYLTLSSPSR